MVCQLNGPERWLEHKYAMRKGARAPPSAGAP
jgi:hypothetical protein